LKVYERLQRENIRAEFDTSDKPIGAKIREATLQKIPYQCIIGEREKAETSDSSDFFVAVRSCEGKDLGRQKISTFIESLKKEIEKKQ
jgi:threonyl-tRNA synthetase